MASVRSSSVSWPRRAPASDASDRGRPISADALSARRGHAVTLRASASRASRCSRRQSEGLSQRQVVDGAALGAAGEVAAIELEADVEAQRPERRPVADADAAAVRSSPRSRSLARRNTLPASTNPTRPDALHVRRAQLGVEHDQRVAAGREPVGVERRLRCRADRARSRARCVSPPAKKRSLAGRSVTTSTTGCAVGPEHRLAGGVEPGHALLEAARQRRDAPPAATTHGRPPGSRL